MDRNDNANHPEFSYQTQVDEYAFAGMVYRDRLVGRFDDDSQLVTLPRISGDHAVKPACAD